MDYKNEFLKHIVDNPKCLDVILDFIAEVFLIVNQQGEIIKVNENAQQTLKYSQEELLNMKLSDLETDNELLKDLSMSNSEQSYSAETKLKTANNKIKHFEITITVVEELENPVFLVFAHDVTYYKEKENELRKTCRKNQDFVDELRKQKNRINTILQTSMDAFWIMDTDGYILETNEAFRDMFGYSLMEIMNININDLDITRDEVSISEKLQEIKKEKKTRFETRYECKNGEIKDLEISVTYVETLDQPIFEVFARDISERKKKEKALRRTQAQLVQSEKMAALGRLVAGVAHEINTPIGVGITAASHITDETKNIIDLYNDNEMKREDLEKYLEMM